MHLIIDGYSKSREILQDEEALRGWLESYPAEIGMTRISAPFVLRYAGNTLEDWGISGFVFIAESHISVHTFVEQSYINIDVFSCKDFDAEKSIKDCQDRFQLVRARTQIIDREWAAKPSMAAGS
jgi:S-adenosylmethionine decarboxylase